MPAGLVWAMCSRPPLWENVMKAVRSENNAADGGGGLVQGLPGPTAAASTGTGAAEELEALPRHLLPHQALQHQLDVGAGPGSAHGRVHLALEGKPLRAWRPSEGLTSKGQA